MFMITDIEFQLIGSPQQRNTHLIKPVIELMGNRFEVFLIESHSLTLVILSNLSILRQKIASSFLYLAMLAKILNIPDLDKKLYLALFEMKGELPDIMTVESESE